MSKIIISVPDSMVPFVLNAEILQPCKYGCCIPIFIECCSGDIVRYGL